MGAERARLSAGAAHKDKRLGYRLAHQDECPNAGEHQSGPADYLDWCAWAESMEQTHQQEECPGCGLYLIWRKRV